MDKSTMKRSGSSRLIRTARAALQMQLPSEMRKAIREALDQYDARKVIDFETARTALARTLATIFDEWGYEGSLAS